MDLKRIIRIEPVDPALQITWRLDLRCNFDCMYCPPQWHSLTGETKTLEQLQMAWQKIHSQRNSKLANTIINFTGGEVTVNKDFLPFVQWLKEQYACKISLTTNGSAGSTYYSTLMQSIDNITFSVHSEFFNEQKFFSNVLACAKKSIGTDKHIQVSIMNEPWNLDRVELYKQFLDKFKIPYQVKEINWDHKTRETNQVNKNKNLFNFEKYVTVR